MRYAIRQDRKVRKPLPGCQLTETEWLACWDTLNKGIESQDDETIQKSKMLVRSAIKKIYTERYPKSKKCVVCGETCGNIRTLQKMLASSFKQCSSEVRGAYAKRPCCKSTGALYRMRSNTGSLPESVQSLLRQDACP
mgnify:CR=1 FL=1